MAIYNFKRETKLYVVRNGLRYILDVYPDLNFSQTFNETSVPVKTLHSQYDMFENAVITKANPANFSFTMPLIFERDLSIITDLLFDYDTTSSEATVKSADLYVESNSEVYKLEKAVVESGTFQIERAAIVVLNISGTASKLSRFTGTIPGTLQALTNTRTYTIPTSVEVKIGGVVKTNVASLSLEFKNNVQWVDYTTLQQSLLVNNASGTQFPGAFVVQSRTLSGNISQYITNETGTTVNNWEVGTPLSIRVGNLNASGILDINIPSAVYTNRIDPQDIYMQSFDFRMLSNPMNMQSVINYLHPVILDLPSSIIKNK